MGGQYDCIIVGAGPAGLGAGLYAARDRFSTLLLEKFFPGGQINTTDRIENYPGFENVGGPPVGLPLAAHEGLGHSLSLLNDLGHRGARRPER